MSVRKTGLREREWGKKKREREKDRENYNLEILSLRRILKKKKGMAIITELYYRILHTFLSFQPHPSFSFSLSFRAWL